LDCSSDLVVEDDVTSSFLRLLDVLPRLEMVDCDCSTTLSSSSLSLGSSIDASFASRLRCRDFTMAVSIGIAGDCLGSWLYVMV